MNKVIAEIETLTSNWEVILVGNFLPNDREDLTPRVVQTIAAHDDRVKAVTLEKKGMMGWDARMGLSRATGNTIAFVDGDDQMPADVLSGIYKKLKSERLDMVKTYRVKRMDGLLRKINSDVYNLLFHILFPGFTVRDVNSKPKIFTREFFNKLKLESNDWFLDAEIMIQARRCKCRIGEVPTVFHALKDRKSFVRVEHIFEFLKNLSRARFAEFFVRR